MRVAVSIHTMLKDGTKYRQTMAKYERHPHTLQITDERTGRTRLRSKHEGGMRHLSRTQQRVRELLEAGQIAERQMPLLLEQLKVLRDALTARDPS